ncbi:hypothetical protein JAAARDRAFT_46567 [Jaapia argillacea MUCL 33604]|uniref:Helitron helicase-like domain-containing protein n=1 Tax=Jaapia argillacea MUCL 33604 TaxID=933084 RepID=A0A067PVT4_9AGAM|nr:hypothetical protein JAAARDRAFT_46567 [Jaapia argillacea MUCL 33604]
MEAHLTLHLLEGHLMIHLLEVLLMILHLQIQILMLHTILHPPVNQVEWLLLLQALHWKAEKLVNSSAIVPLFGNCCNQGKWVVSQLTPLPTELLKLYTDNTGTADATLARAFRQDIRMYNSALAMTSVGVKVDYSVNNGVGPYVYKIQGALYHKMGSLLPSNNNQQKRYAELYFSDSGDALNQRMNANAQANGGKGLNRVVMQTLQNMLYNHNPFVGWRWGMPFNALANPPVNNNAEDEDENPQQNNENNPGRKTLSQREYYSYRLHPRQRQEVPRAVTLNLVPEHGEPPNIFFGGKLFQQYIVDAWVVTNQDRLRWFRNNQTKIRADIYQGLVDAIAQDGCAA